ncbi:MAG: MotA/TolQ/ExbB proton channel family protein [Spirochaetales bacterium]|nr:MotA/TolQ/ExbB proton channel family protein [Spirochaetales bacterium]
MNKLFFCLIVLMTVSSFAFAAEVKAAVSDSINPLLAWFNLGGIFMYGILLLSIIALAVITERVIVYRGEKIHRLKQYGNQALSLLKESKKIEEAHQYLIGKKSTQTTILANGLNMSQFGIDRVEKTIEAQAKILVAKLENKLNILQAIGTTAPLLGFLGTVAGMINAFQAIAVAKEVNAQTVASGIFEALVTTEFGLIIAIPVFFICNYFYHRVDTFASEMERISEEMINFKLINGITFQKAE